MSATNTGRWAFEPAAIPSLPIRGSDALFPVRRIYCIGRNFAAHAIEMGHDPDREPPFFFMKAANSIVPNGATIAYPVKTKDVHHEIEMVVALGKGGRNIPVEKALDHVWGYGVGLDMTRRDIQGEAKKLGRPWEMGKSFDESAPVTALKPASQIGHPAKGAIWLKVNGQVKQSSDLKNMIWSVAEQVSRLSQAFELQPGDIIYSGTPENVGPVVKGDVLECHIDGLPGMAVRVI